MKFNVIYVDAPWHFAGQGSRKITRHYPTMTDQRILNLPIQSITAPNAVCLSWVTFPHLEIGIQALQAWGFTYKTVGFVWAKTNRLSPGFFMGLGYYTRSNPEICLLGTTGKILPRLARDVRQLVVSPHTTHSAKPPEIHDHIVRLFGNIPRIELFARTPTPGWVCLGNEIDGLDIYDSLQITANTLEGAIK